MEIIIRRTCLGGGLVILYILDMARILRVDCTLKDYWGVNISKEISFSGSYLFDIDPFSDKIQTFYRHEQLQMQTSELFITH